MTELATPPIADQLLTTSDLDVSVDELAWFDGSYLPPKSKLRRKRALDLGLGVVLALAALPLIAVFAVCCAIAVRGNPFFVQTRPGDGTRQLRIVKLRTLPKTYPAVGTKPELMNISVPRFRAWLRRRHLDELPQLFSVLTGQMTLVGPRPRQDADVDLLDPIYDRQRRRISQGCTGLWQVSVAASGCISDGLEYDLFYLRHMSVRFDLWILGKTALAMLGRTRRIELADLPGWVHRAGAGVSRRALAYPDETVAVEVSSATP